MRSFFRPRGSYAVFQLSETFFPKVSFSQAVRNYHQKVYDPLAILNNQLGSEKIKDWLKLIENEARLKNFFCKVDCELGNNYLNDRFVFWLSKYAKANRNYLMDFLSGQKKTSVLCQDFINFCFSEKIHLDPSATRASFRQHNYLSDFAVKRELKEFALKNTINIIGYGLDQGEYEKSVASYLLAKGAVKRVNLFGFDPYAKKSQGIHYLSLQDLQSGEIKFDLIIARWVLHHVQLENRWDDFMFCVNSSNDKSNVLIIEHGLLQKDCKPALRQLYFLFNATFDIVANMGLRPQYFTDSKPKIGANFFIEYLDRKEVDALAAAGPNKIKSQIYDVGPNFPNQTIISMEVEKTSWRPS